MSLENHQVAACFLPLVTGITAGESGTGSGEEFSCALVPSSNICFAFSNCTQTLKGACYCGHLVTASLLGPRKLTTASSIGSSPASPTSLGQDGAHIVLL